MIDPDELRPDPDWTDLERERWRIHSDREATWALRKLAVARAESDRIEQAAAYEVETIRAWRDAALAGPARDAAFFEQALIAYRQELEERNPDLPKTYKVPGGTIARRKQTDQFEVTDEPAFTAWAVANRHAELYKLEARTTGLKDFTAENGSLITDDGEVIPGVHLVVRPDTYSAKPG